MKNLFQGKMSKMFSLLLAVAGLLNLSYLVAPLWRISLEAPQYPEGLSLEIWANHLAGDITTVNILNHYIGMAQINEASFPELQLFPYIFLGLLALALIAALLRYRALATAWSAATLGFAAWAMYDFYSWEYKFGHELNPDAAIKMEDMVYQPPLIGEKVFLNITAASWPGWAGLAFTISVLVALIYLVQTVRGRSGQNA